MVVVMSDPWIEVGRVIERLWGHGLTCGAASHALEQASRFRREGDVPMIVGILAHPGAILLKSTFGERMAGRVNVPAVVVDVSENGTVHLTRERNGQTDRFTWALSSMVYWYLHGELVCVSTPAASVEP